MPKEQTLAKSKVEEVTAQPTGIGELDQLLRGGFPKGAAVLLAGASGTGKTILATQWLFAGYDQHKEPGVFMSLTEPVFKSLNNAKKLAFFKKEYINPTQVYFTDLRGVLKGLELDDIDFNRESISKVVETIRNMVEQSGAKRVVLDSITAMAYRLHDRDLIRDFMFQLGNVLANSDATVIMTSEVVGEGYSVFGVEEFISDGILKLSHRKSPQGSMRELEIVKMRGTNYESHPTIFKISKKGILLFPRLVRDLSYEVSEKRLSSGTPGLDGMLDSGLFEGSATLVTGASGSGKTLLALQFIVGGLKNGEKGLYFSFEESRDQIIRNAKSFGWDLLDYEKKGLFRLEVCYPEQRFLEEHVTWIKKVVDEHQAKRVVIDSLSSLGTVVSSELVHDFVSRLNAYLKEKLITVMFTNATATLLGASNISDANLSTMTDSIIMLRFVEIQSEIRHALLILKMRGSRHDKKLRELVFTDTGVQVASEFSGYEGVLTGSTRQIASSMEEQLRSLFVQILGPMGEQVFAEQKAKGMTPEGINKLMDELGDQGIVSKERKAEFLRGSKAIFGIEKTDLETGQDKN